MRLRKEIDEMQEKDILLIAKISDALGSSGQDQNIPLHHAGE